MQTNFVSKSPLLVGLFLLLLAAVSSLGSILLVNISIPLVITLAVFACVAVLLSTVFIHMYIKEIFIYYIEVYLTNIITGSFKDFTRLIESNHSYIKLSFDRTFKSLDEYQRSSSVLNKSIDTKLTEIGLDILERKKSVEIINKKREEAINASKESFKNIIQNIGEMMNESSKDIKETLQELESKEHTKEDISEANLKENKEPKVIEEVKASDLELSKDAVEEEKRRSDKK